MTSHDVFQVCVDSRCVPRVISARAALLSDGEFQETVKCLELIASEDFVLKRDHLRFDEELLLEVHTDRSVGGNMLLRGAFTALCLISGVSSVLGESVFMTAMTFIPL